jgi:hypothetical protein
MRPAARREWEERRRGTLKMLAKDKKARDKHWKWVAKHKAYFGSGESHLRDTLELFALGETVFAEAELDLALRCISKAEEVDDCYCYGKRYERVREVIEDGRSFTEYGYVPAADDGVEPWHDEDLGRALRVRMLFTCRWLRGGERDAALLKRMIGHLKAWLDSQYGLPRESPEAQRTGDTTGSHIGDFVQWCVEAEEFELAKEYCRKEAGRPLSGTPDGWAFTKHPEEVFYLLAVHESGERDLSELFPQALDRCYLWICRQIGRGEIGYHVDEDNLGLAYLRAERMGLPTEPRGLLRRIREDS